MANYIKIKRDKSTQSCITTTVEGNWILEEWEDTEDVGRKIRKLEREVKERFNENNRLEDKMTCDCRLSLQSSKRLENHLSCEGGFLE